MKKKCLAILLTFALLCTILPQVTLFASAEDYSGECGAEGDNLIWTLDLGTGILTVSGSGEMLDYAKFLDILTGSRPPWYSYRQHIKTVIINEGVTSIGEAAFSGCTSLTSVSIPSSVTTINDESFRNCESLTNVYIFDLEAWCRITFPGTFAFATSMPFNNSHGGNLYLNGELLTDLVIPDGIMSINQFAFVYCTSITNITIPKSVTSIGTEAFLGCRSLTDVTIPDSVTSIGAAAFCGCNSLTSVTIPDSVIGIGAQAFNGCSSLKSVNIPNGVTKINAGSFAKCTSLQSMIIPKSVNTIGSWAFENCTALSDLVISNGVTLIDEIAFNECRSLKHVTIPASVTKIGIKAFHTCDSLTSLTILNPSCEINENEETLGIPGTTTIYGFAGSTAEAYAIQNGYTFAALGGDDEATKISVSFSDLANPLQAKYSESFFFTSAYTYNHDLAWLSLCLELSSFTTDSDKYWGEPEGSASPEERSAIEKARTQNLRDAYKKLEFSDSNVHFFNYDKSLNDTSDKVAYAIGTKLLSTGETLISVVVRGGGYGCEWSSNFHVGSGEYYHEGFYTAMSEVYGKVVSSIDAAGGPCTLWITGYSRGAAVANLLAGKMDDLSMTDDRIKADKIFAYTFATPQGVTTKMHPTDSRYGNIYNIVNPGDAVPEVALGNWNFSRYGITKSFGVVHCDTVKQQVEYNTIVDALIVATCNELGSESFNATKNLSLHSHIQALLKIINKSFPTCQEAIPVQNTLIDLLQLGNTKWRNDVNGEISQTRWIYNDNWVSIPADKFHRELIIKYGDSYRKAYAVAEELLKINPKLDWVIDRIIKLKTNPYELRTKISVCLALLQVHGVPANKSAEFLYSVLSAFCIDRATGGEFIADTITLGLSHQPSTYLAWMAQKEEITFGYQGSGLHSWVVKLHCPIDITVFDEAGDCIAEITDHTVVFSEIPVFIDGESTEFYFDESPEAYRVVISPNASGTMTYNITELDENQELVRQTNYHDIPVMPGQEFSGSLLMTEDYSEGMYDLVCVEDDTAVTISADEVFTEGGNVQLTVEESSGGTTTGAGYYYRGDTATLRAYPYDEYEFTGWYREGQLQTTEPVYRIEMTEDISVRAVFTPTTCSHIWAEETVEELPGADDTLAVVCRCEKCGQIQVSLRQKACSHDWVLIETTEATCTETGSNLYSCALCGETKTETIDAFGHNLIRHDAQTPTCIEVGWDAYDTCSRCSYTTFIELPSHGHDYQDEITAPSCTEQGYTKHACSRCRDSYIDTYVVALGHAWGEGVVTKEPTETAKGERSYICSRCGEKRTEEIPELSHVHRYIAMVIAPTCTEKGYTTYTCTCGDSYVDNETAALGHSFGAWITTKASTCTDAGEETHTCSRCGEKEYRAIMATGHDFIAVVTEPTCMDAGFITYTCSKCGNSYTGDEVAKLGHDYKDGVCIRCGGADPDYLPPIDRAALQAAIAAAEKIDRSKYTDETVAAMEAALTAAKAALEADKLADVNDAAAALDAAVKALKEKSVLRFDDVKDPAQYYYEPVYWAVDKSITTGTGAATFSPNAGCTRAQVVTFLWRAADKPEPTKTDNPFIDVKADAYYYKAVLWAVEKGITTGTSATTFRPDATCTRGQIVTFLWRCNDKPEPTKTDNPFADVKADQYYYKAVLWAVEKGITKGTSDTKFSPDSTCTRGQIVTFLYRDKK